MLTVENLQVTINARGGYQVQPVRGVSFTVRRGETLALVGESGCGKSMTCLALSGLLPKRAYVSDGAVTLDDSRLTGLDARAMRDVRRKSIAFVFQDATNGLNPVKTIGWQIAEAVMLREGLGRRQAARTAVELLARVGMPDPHKRVNEFPHQLSGGMNQRAMIALAVAGSPKLLIADEATTALDVTIQAQILALLDELRREVGMAVIFVTHDLGLVAEMANKVAVMYAGRIVESAPVRDLFSGQRHPYTRGLIGSLPRVDQTRDSLAVIEGQVPALTEMPAGCAFAPRCTSATPACGEADPALSGDHHRFACFNPVAKEKAA